MCIIYAHPVFNSNVENKCFQYLMNHEVHVLVLKIVDDLLLT